MLEIVHTSSIHLAVWRPLEASHCQRQLGKCNTGRHLQPGRAGAHHHQSMQQRRRRGPIKRIRSIDREMTHRTSKPKGTQKWYTKKVTGNGTQKRHWKCKPNQVTGTVLRQRFANTKLEIRRKKVTGNVDQKANQKSNQKSEPLNVWPLIFGGCLWPNGHF